MTRVACELIGAEGTIATLLDDHKQVVVSATGPQWRRLAGASMPRETSFCQWVVDHESPLVIPDAHLDPRLANHANVIELGIRSYLGVPLRTADGDIRGALCAVGGAPRDWSDSDIRKLMDVAALAMGGMAPSTATGLTSGSRAQDHARPGLPSDDVRSLTSREHEVLALMARGLGNQAIAVELAVSLDTVKSHVSSVLRKLQVPSRSAALVAAFERHLLDPAVVDARRSA